MRFLLVCRASLAFTTILLCHNAVAVTSILWDKSPIKIDLIVGVEQLVHFDSAATVGLPPALSKQETFRHLFASDTAYWKAMRPFATQRVKMRLNGTGEILLFDVSATTKEKPPASIEPIRVLVKALASTDGDSRVVEDDSTGSSVSNEDAPTLFDLLRYAVQSDYSPARVIAPLPGVREMSMRESGDVSFLYAHSDAVYLDMRVTNVWSMNSLYVASILITNKSPYEIVIDPSRMQHSASPKANGLSNQFVGSAMINRVLGPGKAKARSDWTRLYIVTDKPLHLVIRR